MIGVTLIVPAFIAGIFTFFAPCTLPLVPGYIGFISGVSYRDLRRKEHLARVRRDVFWNGVLYVLGFSLVFIILGSLFSVVGVSLAPYRPWLSRVGGIFVIIFGLTLMQALPKPFFFLFSEKRLRLPLWIHAGNPVSSFLFGAAFAFGWTPCIGPILGSILVLASTTETVREGMMLLFVYSLGLALPFLFVALFLGSSLRFLTFLRPYVHGLAFVGGILLIGLGLLLLTDSFALWLTFFYDHVSFLPFSQILNYL